MSTLSIFLLLLILLINYGLFKKIKYSKKLFILSNIIIIFNYILALLLYYNNIILGFDNGIVFGDKLTIHAIDEYKYFMESDTLANLLKENGISAWFNKSLDPFPFAIDNKPYGIYNNYVAFLGFLKFFGISSVVEIVTVKLIFTMFNTLLLNKIFSKFLNEKLTFIAIIIFNIAPAYLLSNITLMRDNIILFAILLISTLLLSKKVTVTQVLLCIIGIVLLFDLRSYTLLAIFAAFIFSIKQFKTPINLFDISFIIITVLSLVLLNKLEFSVPEINYLKVNYLDLYGPGISGILLFLYSLVKSVVVYGLFLNAWPTTSLYVVFTTLGSLFYIVLMLIFIYKAFIIIFIDKTKSKMFLTKFAVYFMILNSCMLMLKDGFIPNRLGVMWFPFIILIILLPASTRKKSTKIS